MLSFEKEKQFVCWYSNGGGGMRTDKEWAVANASDAGYKSGRSNGFLIGLKAALEISRCKECKSAIKKVIQEEEKKT